MDPLDFLETEELLRFFHCNKTQMSCMENPRTFLNQLRDYDLIPEEQYKKVSRMKSKDNMKRSLYDILDWLEKKGSDHILVFWRCVFMDTIINLYPTLQQLRKSLMDGSYHVNIQLPEKLEKEDKKTRKELSEEEERSTTKKRKLRCGKVCDDEEMQPGPSSRSTPVRQTNKILFCSSTKKGEQKDFWNWPLYKSQLPVTCGQQKGSLSRDRLEKGEKCILFEKQWITPSEFEKLGGKKSSKNWKMSIRCMDIPLGKLIKAGHLKSARYKKQHKKARRMLFQTDRVNTVFEGEEKEDDDDDDENEDDVDELENQEDLVSSSAGDKSTDENSRDSEEQTNQQRVFKVTCGNVAGTLHKKRFASGTCGKSIRTEKSWLSPTEFLKEASCQADATWKKDIKVDGRPLSVLLEENVLKIHSLLCVCRLCHPDYIDMDHQRNDDECFVCKSEVGPELVVCDRCPRAFHQKCHLPFVDDATLKDSRPWLCTCCVFQTTQDWRYSDRIEMGEALSHHISRHLLECQYLLLLLYNADEQQTFALNPTPFVENYSTIIQTPMWLGKVVAKLQMKEYKTVGEFVTDIQLIFTNCAKFNQVNAEFLAQSHQLKELFNREFNKVFSICQQADEQC